MRKEPDGEILSHAVLPLCTETVAVNDLLLEALTDSVLDGGAALPTVALKDSEVGMSVSPAPSCAMDAQLNPITSAVSLIIERERGISTPSLVAQL